MIELEEGRHPAWRQVSPAAAARVLRLLLLCALLAATTWLAFQNLSAWLDYGRNYLARTDFALYYVFARTGLESGWQSLYDLSAQRLAYRQIPGLWWFPFNYTPPMAWIAAPFTLLSPSTAYWIWCAGVAAAFAGAWWLAAPRTPLMKAVCLTAGLAPYLSLLGLELGQFIPVSLLAVALSVWLIRRERPVLAGLALLPIDVHPQGFFLVPIALLVFGARRTFYTWALASALLVLISAASVGEAGVLGYAHRLVQAERSPLEYYVALPVDFPYMVPGRLLKLGAMAAVSVCSLFVAWQQRGRGLEVAIAASLVGSLLVTSFIHLDDLMALILAGWLCLRARLPAPYAWLMIGGLVVAVSLDFDHAASRGWAMVAFELVWLGMLAGLPIVERFRRRTSTPSTLDGGTLEAGEASLAPT
ncbi:MAG: DUF2029 domain-containing protein [Acidimicrobiaceae bacterium]|nr:DUF2029 domain-containing protein [Acidimicrobiaceae bacterium]